MENKKPIRVAAYIRVGNASQITHKEPPVMNTSFESRIHATLNIMKQKEACEPAGIGCTTWHKL